ncbi:MAG: monovalent cation/H(+) antiporter subunit G [Planctomycetota bacterium]
MMDTIGMAVVGIGLFFDLMGCIGLVRFPDVYTRLHASTKCVTFGTCCVLFGAFLILGPSAGGVKALLCIAFLLLTAPVSAHALSRSAHKFGVKLWEKSVTDAYEKDLPKGRS